MVNPYRVYIFNKLPVPKSSLSLQYYYVIYTASKHVFESQEYDLRLTLYLITSFTMANLVSPSQSP